MNSERWRQLDQLLDAALEHPPVERAAFLAEVCAGDEALHRQMEALLRSDEAVEHFIEAPAVALAAELLTEENQAQSLLGQRLGHYQVLTQLGAGGMGEVYRARDTRLGREVALKVLPNTYSQDADRLRRFEQEARAISALNHPNILTIYDIGTHAGMPYIVTELLEGGELRAQLNTGALPAPKAIEYAQQIAAGLTAAHDKGIVHRDLKPENLFVTKEGRVKILDFGLAKLRPQKFSGGVDSESPTIKPLTHPGVVMGTVGYMSPEQVRGQETDQRADIFSFGIILYEMLAGQRTFSGDSLVELMNAILKEEPPELSQTQAAGVSPQLEMIVRHCLEKQPERRFQSARDLGFALAALAAPSAAVALRPAAGPTRDTTITQRAGWHAQRFAWLTAGAIALLALLALGWAYFKRAQPEARVVRFTHLLPEKTNLLGPSFAISPDGQQLVFATADANGKILLYLRPLNSFSAQAIPNTEDATLPFWSPDGRSIGFFSDEKLKRIELSGSGALTLCNAQSAFGGAWSRTGEIIFSAFSNPLGAWVLFRVPATGGAPVVLAPLDAAREESVQCWPQFLPDGQHFLYFSSSKQPVYTGIYAGSLADKTTKLVLNTEHSGAWTSGYLLFGRNRTLTAQACDSDTLKLSGEMFPITEQVKLAYGNFVTHLSVSESGVLAFQSGGSQSPQLVWFDRSGKQLGTVGEPAEYFGPSLTADDKRLVVAIRDPMTKKRDLWLFELARGAKSRFTFDPADDCNPVWSYDGSRIFFTSDRKGQRDLFQKQVDVVGATDELLYTSPELKNVEDLTPDGRLLIYNTNRNSKTRTDLWLLPLEGERQPRLFLQTQFTEDQATISPDGRWVAYHSNESGSHEVYVATFPQLDRKSRVSLVGGTEPRWRQDGKELFFIAGDKKLMAVEVKPGSSALETGVPKLLFETLFSSPGRNRYVVTKDGQRFLVITRLEDPAAGQINVVVNWKAEMKK